MAFLSVALFASCGGKLSEVPADYFSVDPQVLELKTGKVDAIVTTKFPPKFFPKKATLTMTPVLVSADGKELAGTPVTYQGENISGNNQIILYKEGAVATQLASFIYEEGFEKASLYMTFAATVGTKEVTLPRVKIADGVIITSNLVTGKDLAPWLANDRFQKTVEETVEAQILFLIEQSNLRSSELNSKSVVDLISKLKDTETGNIKGLNVQAYASPDGPEALNYRLAEQRQKVTVDYLKKQTPISIGAKFTAEDWDGFKQLVEASDIPEKGLILNILSTYSDPDQREAEIRKMSSVFTRLADEILPQLRRSKINLTMEVLGKSDEEIVTLIKTDVNSLTADEILYGANTLISSKSERAAAYQAVINNFPQDWRGHNNLGYIKFEEGDFDAAGTLFEKALSIASNATTNYNMCLISLVKGDFEKASSYLSTARARGAVERDLADARALIQIHNGEYAAAVTTVEGRSSNVAALAQILRRDYNKATATLGEIQNPTAITDYLKAIVGARTNNKNEVITNLRAAIEKDASLANRAKRDIEFAKFFTDSDFLKAIVK